MLVIHVFHLRQESHIGGSIESSGRDGSGNHAVQAPSNSIQSWRHLAAPIAYPARGPGVCENAADGVKVTATRSSGSHVSMVRSRSAGWPSLPRSSAIASA